MATNTYCVGADPEIFIKHSKTEQLLSVVGKIGGTKERPIPIPGLSSRYTMQEDNVALEFNIPPTSISRNFDKIIQNSLHYLQQGVLPNAFNTPYATILPQTFSVWPNALLSDEKAQTFGCSPDNDAYTEGEVIPQITPKDLLVRTNSSDQYRFAGGHIHLSYENKIPHFVIAHFCDIFLGLPCMFYEKQGPRRSFYGKAGRFRAKPYGIEYRTLGNDWVHNHTVRKYVNAGAFGLLMFLKDNTNKDIKNIYNQIPWFDIQKCINTEDRPVGAQIIKMLSGIDIINSAFGCGIYGDLVNFFNPKKEATITSESIFAKLSEYTSSPAMGGADPSNVHIVYTDLLSEEPDEEGGEE